MVQICVDDIIFGSTNELLCKYFSSLMQKEFEMSMMKELKFFLGLKIKPLDGQTFIHQTKYVKELLKTLKLNEVKTMTTPMHPTTSLGLQKETNSVDINRYRQMIASLLYLTTFRPNVMFSVCLCAIF